jgi:two-component system, cell cycle response regulator
MTARVLVVDDLIPNVKLLEAKLRAEYFEVSGAFSGLEAIEKAESEQPDIILLDVMMPGIDGFETCRRLKASSRTCHIPVVMVTALDQAEDRIAGLEAGADDFLTKPVEDVALFARVRNLSRLKILTDDLRQRNAQGAELGILTNSQLAEFDDLDSTILFIDNLNAVDSPILDGLPEKYKVIVETDPISALQILRSDKVDLIVINMALEEHDPLRLCSTIRSLEQTRHTPLLALVRQGDTRKLVRALDIGVNDYLMRPVNKEEMAARIRTQVRRNHYIASLRNSFHASLEMAITDELTGLYNRRYFSNHLSSLFERSQQQELSLSTLILDIDHFKKINDTYGHDVGDAVLVELSTRLERNVRGIDLACRYGGEEFVILMPETDMAYARMIAERLREDIASRPIEVKGDKPQSLDITVSIGLATTDWSDGNESPQRLVKRADDALYRAKETGRNKVEEAA